MQGRPVSRLPSAFVGRRPRRWLHLLLLVGVAVAVTFPATDAAARLLGIAQLPGGQACIAQPEEESEAIGKCAKGGRGLLDANEVSVSPDGRSVYVAGTGSDAVAAFGRDVESGRITERNCVSANGTNGYDGTGGQCADGDALTGASSTTVSPDGNFVYVTSSVSNGIAIFTRNQTTGSLKQIGCVRAVRTCTPARALGGASSLAITLDGKNAYMAAAESDAVAEFARNPDTGALSFIGCISDDGTDRTCAKGNALRGPFAVVASPDGKHVYVAAAYSDSLLTFRRDSQSGLLARTGCVMDSAPRPGSCVRGRAMSGIVALTLTRDGRTLFAAASASNALAVFARNPVGGAIKEIGCVSEPYDEYEGEDGQARNDGCAHYRPMGYPTGVAVTPDGGKVSLSVESGLTAFDRDRVSGGLKPIGCPHLRRHVGRGSPQEVWTCVRDRRCLRRGGKPGQPERLRHVLGERRSRRLRPRCLVRTRRPGECVWDALRPRRVPPAPQHAVQRPDHGHRRTNTSTAGERLVPSRSRSLGCGPCAARTISPACARQARRPARGRNRIRQGGCHGDVLACRRLAPGDPGTPVTLSTAAGTFDAVDLAAEAVEVGNPV